MPGHAGILGFENRWQAEALPHAIERGLRSAPRIRAGLTPYLLATKLEAFKDADVKLPRQPRLRRHRRAPRRPCRAAQGTSVSQPRKTKVVIRQEVLELLERQSFDDLIGQEEGLELEFKGAPYRLDEDVEKFELAKDVSGLANAEGGLIVIGVRTQAHLESPVDVAQDVRPIPRARLDEGRHAAVLNERVYPRIRGLAIRYHESPADPAVGLLSIDVPPQGQADKYFLVQRPVSADGKTPGWLVGVMVRGVGRVHEHRPGELHGLINRGLNVGRQLTDIATAVADVQERVAGAASAVAANPTEAPAARLTEVIQARMKELSS
jgi:hypothetical protein